MSLCLITELSTQVCAVDHQFDPELPLAENNELPPVGTDNEFHQVGQNSQFYPFQQIPKRPRTNRRPIVQNLGLDTVIDDRYLHDNEHRFALRYGGFVIEKMNSNKKTAKKIEKSMV